MPSTHALLLTPTYLQNNHCLVEACKKVNRRAITPGNACIKGFKVLFTSAAKLLTQLLNDKADGTYLKKLNHITRHNLLILDDFGLHPLQEADQLILYDLIEDMTHKNALIVTSQIPIEHWHQLITQSTLADAVMDRIIHNAHRIDLKGHSLRKNIAQNP